MGLLEHIVIVWRQYRHFQAALAELGRLTDRELSDLGLTRGDIGRVAFEEAERRTEAAAARRPRRGDRHRAPGSGARGSVLDGAEVLSSGRLAS